MAPYKLSEIVDPNGDKFSVTVEKDKAKEFVSYSSKTNELVFKAKTMAMSDDLSFTLTISDDNQVDPKESEYEMTIKCPYCVKLMFFGV